MKNFILFTSLFLIFCNGFAQKITKEEFEIQYNFLLENLDKENWKKSEKLTADLLKITEKDTTYNVENRFLRYIYIYANAGLLNEKVITKEEAFKKTKHLKGKEMIMPAHPFNPGCHVNCTSLSKDEKNTFFSGVNNAAGTYIFSFEYVKIKDEIIINPAELEGKNISLSGTLNEISVEGNMLPRYKLHFIEGAYQIIETD